MATRKLVDYLEHNNIQFNSLKHQRTFSAKKTAASAHIKGKEMAKTLLLKLDDQYTMAVLPADYKVDMKRIKQISGAKYVELATEWELEKVFPDCKVGAMPPFGNLYHIPVIVDKTLEEDTEICFNAGTHKELFQIKYQDYKKLVHPRLANIHRHPNRF